MLDMFFSPKSVAIVGASADPQKLGHRVLKNIIEDGYKGKIYPVNPSSTSILGLKVFSSLKEIPGQLDLAVVVVPAKFVLPVVKEAAQAKVKGLIIISAGFRETGPEGLAIEQEMLKIAQKSGMRIIGPNCLGLIDTKSTLNASFVGDMPDQGNVALISQSGAICSAVLDWSYAAGIGFSKFISVGNKADVAEPDLLRALGKDKQTKVIMLYAEEIQDGREFMQAVEEVSRIKPVIAVKAGRSAAGQKAISSHTGSLAGDDIAYTLALKQTGAVRCKRLADMFNLVDALSHQQVPKGKRIAVITNAGGPGVIATDAIEEAGLEIALLSQTTTDKLKAYLPSAASMSNPIDVLGDAMSDRYGYALQQIVADKNVDGVLVILTPQAMTDTVGTAKTIGAISQQTDKPVLACWIGQKETQRAYPVFKRFGLPHFNYPESAVYALQKMYTYSQRQQRKSRNWRLDAHAGKRTPRINQIFAQIEKEGRCSLSEQEARQVVQAYGFRLPNGKLVSARTEVEEAVAAIGGPVVMKVSSPDILHKTDIGVIEVGIDSPKEALHAWDRIMKNVQTKAKGAHVDGMLIDPLISDKHREVIIGMKRNPQFGPMLMVGLGGIFVEVLKDVAFRLVPLSKQDAREMISEIASYPLLMGARGEIPFDVEAIADNLVALSQLVIDYPEISEIDINPLFVFGKGNGTVGVDVKMLTTQK